ncbi:hypothetical protein [Candidatus Vondammii sp. HM_W22]|uniref:hypothetical protein n=1 Tax=Candidatus Vondammii sp. HM_W22 TaxID=2687299 RepID=UPI001F13A03D|nr:hypothetical protein [Candidatus Vondammii sp. HM_W22]
MATLVDGNSTFTTVTFRQTYPVPPLVFATPTDAGSDPAVLRIRNVTTTDFQVIAVEASGSDGVHQAMTFAYIAVEPGSHTFPDGTQIEAFASPTTSVQHGIFLLPSTGPAEAWDIVNYPNAFSSRPVVLSMIQGMANETGTVPGGQSIPFLSVAMRSVTSDGLSLALQRAESYSGTVTNSEVIGVLAIQDIGTTNFIDNLMSSTLRLETLYTAVDILGWGDCITTSFASPYVSNPLVTATMVTLHGDNGGWIRRCSLSTSQVGLVVDEDVDMDTEREHVPEQAAVIIFSRAFDADFFPHIELSKVVQTVLDDVNGTIFPKAIPGATVEYSIEVGNQGLGRTDQNSVVISDNIPSELALVVSDIGAVGSGPMLFLDGATTSGLSYTFSSLSSLTDDIEFSRNGINFNYVPVDSGNGTDPLISHVRVTLQGRFNQATPVGRPNFRLRFRAQVQ